VHASRFIRPALVYVGLVFAVGFVLGALRVVFVVPAIGVRWAELIEQPLMIAASWLAARRVIRRHAIREPAVALGTGLLAAVLLLVLEVGLGAALGGRGPAEVLLDKDPVSGPAYYASVCTFGLLPWWLTRRSRPRS
jgi:hypothetical protein